MACNLLKVTAVSELLPCALDFVQRNPKTSGWIALGLVIAILAFAALAWRVALTFLSRLAYGEKRSTLKAEQDHAADTKVPEAKAKLPLIIAIESFPRRPVENEAKADYALSLMAYFDGRFIKDPSWWSDRVWPDLQALFAEVGAKRQPVHLRLDAHASIAYACGVLLDLKSGLPLEVEQRMDGKTETWRPTVGRDARPLPALVEVEEMVEEGGREIAVGLSVTRPVEAHLRTYVGRSLPQIGCMVFLTPQGEPGQGAVMDGDHAARLADSIANALNDLRGRLGAGRIHLFASCPNSVMVALGRRSQSFGAVRLYEFDFQQARDGSYGPSLDFGPRA